MTDVATSADGIRAMILNSKGTPPRTQTVHVPEWGMDVTVRALTRREVAELQARMVDKSGDLVGKEVRLADQRIIAASVVDERGNLLFSETDIVQLGNADGAALHLVADVARRLSGMIEAEHKARIDSIVGNSAARPVSAG